MSKPTRITPQTPRQYARSESPTSDHAATEAVYVKPTLRSLGSWQLVVRQFTPTTSDNFFQFDTFD